MNKQKFGQAFQTCQLKNEKLFKKILPSFLSVAINLNLKKKWWIKIEVIKKKGVYIGKKSQAISSTYFYKLPVY